MSWLNNEDCLEDSFRKRRRRARFVIFTIIEMKHWTRGSLWKRYFYRIEDCPGTSAMITWGGPGTCWVGNMDEARMKLNTLKALHPTWHFELEELEEYGLG